MNTDQRRAENLARCIIAWEAHDSDPARSHAAARAIEKLRLHLTPLVGTSGFSTLLARALDLAKKHQPWRESVHINADGTLAGWEEPLQGHDLDDAREAEIALLTRLLGLLLTFIGETLTLRMAQNVWSDLNVDDLNVDTEETTP